MQVPLAPPLPNFASFYQAKQASSKFFSSDLENVNELTKLWMKIAAKKGVDITNEWEKIRWTIVDGLSILEQTSMNEVILVQQIKARLSYCYQIMQKVRHVIPQAPPAPKFAQPKTVNKEFKKLTFDDLLAVNYQTKVWLQTAKKEGVNVDKVWEKIRWTILEGLSLIEHTGTMNEVQLVHQIVTRRWHCCQIIRKIAFHRIEKFADFLCSINPENRSRSKFIEGCKDWALKRLPSRMCLSPENMESECQGLLNKVEEMKTKILKKEAKN